MVTRVLVVDDSALARDQLATVVTAELGFDLAGVAAHGLQAVDLAEALRPDLVTLDVRMPVMNGLTALKHIMSRRPVPVVMVSAFTRDDSHLTFDCLRCGALDFVPKPSGTGTEGVGGQRQLIAARLQQAAAVAAGRCWYCRLQRVTPAGWPEGNQERAGVATAAAGNGAARRLLLVAGGRGSIAPLLKLVNLLPLRHDLAVLVVLDLPAPVVDSLALYLSRFSRLAVTAVSDDQVLLPARIHLVPVATPCLVAAREDQLRLQRLAVPAGLSGSVLITTLASSCTESCPGEVTFVLLSGAPSGVLAAMQAAHRGNGDALVQEPASALEPSVPAAAAAAGLAGVVAEPVALSRAVVRRLTEAG